MCRLMQLYDKAVEQAKKEGLIFSDKIVEILDRKWAVSNDLENGIGRNGVVITGINPSYDPKYEGPQYYSFSSACNRIVELESGIVHRKYWKIKEQYWIIAKDLFYDNVLSRNIGFVDLFPIRCTDQKDFEHFDFTDTEKILKRNLLQVTQQEIEKLSPRLIVHANKRSGFYWGIDRSKPWMGYEFGDINDSEIQNKEQISSLLSRNKEIEARIITGKSHDDRVICKNKEQVSSLANHTIVLFYCQLGYQQLSNERRQKDKAFFRELFELLGVE